MIFPFLEFIMLEILISPKHKAQLGLVESLKPIS